MPAIDLLESVNQKYTPTAPLTATNVQAALDEAAPILDASSQVFYQATDPLASATYGDIWVLSP